ncbi:hypothetical protein ACXJY6_01785 [Vibrio sp. RC27]
MNQFSSITADSPSSQTDYLADHEQQCRDIIYTLERELTRNPKCVDSLRGWIASYQKLSRLYLQDGEIELAQQCLLIPHRSVLHMANCKQADDEQKLIGRSAMRLTLPPLLELARKYPPCDSCVRDLERQRRALELDAAKYHS